MRFILASNNKKKLVELEEILSEMGYEVISQAEAGLNFEAEETGTTFAQNAQIKAEAACRLTGEPGIADDSGLVIDALNGEPGVYSARYGGDGLDDIGRYELILEKMKNVEHRAARFVSSIACVFPDGEIIRAEGECHGVITHAPKGGGGFGYDPIFLFPQLGKTMAEITKEEKNKISHRAAALLEFKVRLEEYLREKSRRY